MNAPSAFPDQKPVPPYKHTPLFPLGKDETPYRKISSAGVRVETVLGRDMLVVEREALRAQLASERTALAELTATLEQRVEQRTADLMKEVAARERAQEQLRHAQKMEALGQLT